MTPILVVKTKKLKKKEYLPYCNDKKNISKCYWRILRMLQVARRGL